MSWRSSVEYHGSHILLLNQQELPHKTIYEKLETIEEVWDAIRSLKVRGAPAIGITAAFGLAVWANRTKYLHFPEFLKEFQRNKELLATSRPTAVNLFCALNRVSEAVHASSTTSIAIQNIEKVARRIQQEDERVCRSIGEHALSLFHDEDRILTICNAGAIATARYGTALAPFYLGKERGYNFQVYTCETRPVLQGARLTTWELQQIGVDVTLITDNMVAHTMKEKNISAVIVGCDRVARNGDTANKIGTFGLAIQSKAFGIPFYVAAPLSTVDLETANGEEIPIEKRHADEVTTLYGHQVAPRGTKVYNPAFDVTPHHLITGIITEKGVMTSNFEEKLIKQKQL